MALRVAESLRDCGGFAVSDIGIRYIDWWHDGAFDTGPTVERVLSLVESGIQFAEAARRVHEWTGGLTAGCNPAHRSAPLAMCASIDDALLPEAAMEEAQLTHKHPLAGDVAGAVVRLCRTLICGMPWQAAKELAAEGRRSETRSALSLPAVETRSPDGFAPGVLAAAIDFLDSSDSFSTALARSIEFAGPANYCPVLVGSIGGARWGSSNIDLGALHLHEDLLPRLNAVALSLANGWDQQC